MTQQGTPVNVLLVGQDGAGKTSLLSRFISEKLPGDDDCLSILPIVPFSKKTSIEGGKNEIRLSCWENFEETGNVGNDCVGVNPQCYPMADVILFVTPINIRHDEFREDCCSPELWRLCPGVPVILVGSKVDLRNENSVSFEDGQQMAEKIGAVKYMECSALENTGVEEIFEEAAMFGFQYFSSHITASRIKLVITGPTGMGKTCLLIRYNTRIFPQTYIPKTHSSLIRMLDIDQEKVNVAFWDTGGGEDYERLRPLSYPDTDVFLLVNEVISLKDEFDGVHDYCWPELSHHCPGVPAILAGSKVDLRNENSISFEEGQQMAEKIGAVKYMECSALSGEGVDEVFEEAARIGYEHQKKMNHQKRKCCICL